MDYSYYFVFNLEMLFFEWNPVLISRKYWLAGEQYSQEDDEQYVWEVSGIARLSTTPRF